MAENVLGTANSIINNIQSKKPWINVYQVPNTVLGTLHKLSHLIQSHQLWEAGATVYILQKSKWGSKVALCVCVSHCILAFVNKDDSTFLFTAE